MNFRILFTPASSLEKIKQQARFELVKKCLMAQQLQDFKGFFTMLSRSKLKCTIQAFVVDMCLVSFSAKLGMKS